MQENAFENVACEIAAILSGHQSDNIPNLPYQYN